MIESYVDSLFEFASVHVETAEAIERLRRPGGGYNTTESEVLQSFSPLATSVTHDQGLGLAQESSRRLREQVSFLRQRQPGSSYAGATEVPQAQQWEPVSWLPTKRCAGEGRARGLRAAETRTLADEP